MNGDISVESIDVAWRQDRRSAAAFAIKLLHRIYLAEYEFYAGIPSCLLDCHDAAIAEEILETLVDAIRSLNSAFDYPVMYLNSKNLSVARHATTEWR